MTFGDARGKMVIDNKNLVKIEKKSFKFVVEILNVGEFKEFLGMTFRGKKN